MYNDNINNNNRYILYKYNSNMYNNINNHHYTNQLYYNNNQNIRYVYPYNNFYNINNINLMINNLYYSNMMYYNINDNIQSNMNYNQNINGILTELPKTNNINFFNGKKNTKEPM
jgi:hypothetical protein